ncbi:uncharacterized protein L203_100807 [Cryptococcus depauperatus CBS 7841]|uniref:Uncharacterized protein n=1 Tax=Cryptococcus depauperatus CBS 7841 TaxID=1295531 RepID=A0A1E3IY26_9TREE|nr:hypothetical protein L203_00596 [Cryptococcus depauperatus CBS 7841]
MKFYTATLMATLFLASTVAQKLITTIDPVEGNTVVLSLSTNARGAIVTSTLSTINGDAAVTPVVDDGNGNADPTTKDAKKPTTAAERVVGNTVSEGPMRITTYWIDTGNGYQTVYTWTAPTTVAPTVATANVPAGIIQPYSQFQSNVNSAIFSSAQAAAKTPAAGARRAQPVGMDSILPAWMTFVVGAVGAGLGLLAL